MQFRRRGVMLTLLMLVGLVVVPAIGSVSAAGFEVEWDESVPVGEVATVRGVVPEGATSVATEVKDGEEWVPAEPGVIDVDGGFEIELTDKIDGEGVFTFRVVVETPDGPLSSKPLEVVRTAVATPEGGEPELTEPEAESGLKESEVKEQEVKEPAPEPKDSDVSLEGETLASASVSVMSAVSVSVSHVGSKPVGQLTRVWGRVNGLVKGEVFTEVRVGSGWSRSQRTLSDSSGYFQIPLTYGASSAGVYTYRVVVETEHGPVRSDSFQLTRTPSVAVSHVGSKPVGNTTQVWGRVNGVVGGQVYTEVLTPSGWSVSQRTRSTSTGYFEIPLTYGASRVGVYRYRVRAATPSGSVYSREFRLTRTGSVSASSAGSKPVGASANVWGRVSGYGGGRVWTEVRTGNGWSRSQTRTSTASGFFQIPLTYGSTTVGQYTYRVGTATSLGTVYSKPFTIERTAASGLGTCSRQSSGKAVMVDKVAMRLWLCRDGAVVSGLMPFTSGARYQAPQGVYRVGFERAVWWSVGGAPLYNFTGFAKGVGGGNIGFHRYLGMPENEVGTERWRGASGGCFRMRSLDAQILQGFTDIGTRVHVLNNG